MNKKILLGALIVIISAAALWTMSVAKKAQPLLPAPIAVQTFKDGSRIELLQVVRGKIEHGTLNPTTHGHTGGTYTYGLHGRPVTKWVRSLGSGELIGHGFDSDFLDPLLVEFFWKAPDGTPKLPSLVYSDGRVDRIGLSGSGPAFKLRSCVKAQEMMSATTSGIGVPDLLVQLSDGQGGWINGEGPAVEGKEPLGLSAVYFPMWARNVAELRLRYVSCGQPAVEFTVANPAYVASRLSLGTPVALPARLANPEFEVVLEKMEMETREEGYPTLTPYIHLHAAKGDGWYWKWTTKELTDEWGNKGCQRFLDEGFCLPTGSEKILIRGEATPTRAYPRKVSECMLVGEGVIDPSGGLALTKTKDAEKLGMDAVSCAPLPPDNFGFAVVPNVSEGKTKENIPGNPSVSSQGFVWTVSGEMDGPQMADAKARYGDSTQWQIVAFLGDDDESDGMIDDSQIGSHSRSDFHALGLKKETFGYQRQQSWVGRPVPGQRVRIGIVGPKLPVPVEFVVEWPVK